MLRNTSSAGDPVSLTSQLMRWSLVGSSSTSIEEEKEDQMPQENTPQPQPPPQSLLPNNPDKLPLSSSFPVAITPLAVAVAVAVAVPIPTDNHSPPMEMENHPSIGQVNQLTNSPEPITPIPILPSSSSKMTNLKLNRATTIEPPSLSLNLSTSSSPPSNQEQSPSTRQALAFQSNSFNGGGGDANGNSNSNSIISVA
ncbi:proline-rich receptor-like protein kinase PERK9 [Andrographis paniculata]|uniref:proline-rich receptor-like protein kinase PERK9 n=1 Tax=Andrographis paniculata TaxID=175694 RepID=UPI0021E85A47|nr:proline-rich receptor-like protein kinase PERK9 [Andrographis paniculata]